jgi:pSer/pThr/pTyr-binding forkhead associated (FHA) protein
VTESEDDDVLERTAALGDRVFGKDDAPRLVVIDGRGGGRGATLGPEPLLIGRREDCGLRLDSPAVSKRHAEVRLAAAGAILVDLGSRNGVRINGRALAPGEPASLAHGDVVEISDHRLLFLDERGASDFERLAAPDRAQVAADADALWRLFDAEGG